MGFDFECELDTTGGSQFQSPRMVPIAPPIWPFIRNFSLPLVKQEM